MDSLSHLTRRNRSPFYTEMATNINCKKKWHPSRHETQTRVKEAEEVEKRAEAEEKTRKENGRREFLDAQISRTSSDRMKWML